DHHDRAGNTAMDGPVCHDFILIWKGGGGIRQQGEIPGPCGMAPVFASLYFDGGYVSLTTKNSSRATKEFGVISEGAGGAHQSLGPGQRAGLQLQRKETGEI